MGLVLRLFWYILGTLYINLYTVCFMYPNKFLLIVIVVCYFSGRSRRFAVLTLVDKDVKLCPRCISGIPC